MISPAPEIPEEILQRVIARLRGTLSDYRYRHTMGVAEEAEHLGELFGAYPRLLYAAGLLHDLTKEWTTAQQESFLAAHGIPCDPDLKAAPALYHGLTASLLVPEQFPELSHPLLLSAVCKHTAGDVEMNLYDKLLFVADYIEPGRDFTPCVRARKRFYRNLPQKPEDRPAYLDREVLAIMNESICNLIAKGKYIACISVRARNALLAAIGGTP